MKYQLFAHRIYGNEEDGYEVDGSFSVGDIIELPEDWSLEQLKAVMTELDILFPPDFILDPHNAYDQEIQLEEACGKPMGFLRAV